MASTLGLRIRKHVCVVLLSCSRKRPISLYSLCIVRSHVTLLGATRFNRMSLRGPVCVCAWVCVGVGVCVCVCVWVCVWVCVGVGVCVCVCGCVWVCVYLLFIYLLTFSMPHYIVILHALQLSIHNMVTYIYNLCTISPFL